MGFWEIFGVSLLLTRAVRSGGHDLRFGGSSFESHPHGSGTLSCRKIKSLFLGRGRSPSFVRWPFSFSRKRNISPVISQGETASTFSLSESHSCSAVISFVKGLSAWRRRDAHYFLHGSPAGDLGLMLFGPARFHPAQLPVYLMLMSCVISRVRIAVNQQTRGKVVIRRVSKRYVTKYSPKWRW